MTAEKPKQGRGCVFYGCLTLLILTTVGALTAYFVIRSAVRTFVSRYTEDHPARLPKVTTSEADWLELQSRVIPFSKALDSGSGGDELSLSPMDVNNLIAEEPALAFLRDHVFVTIETNEIKAQISVPLDNLWLKGRYLNGSSSFQLSLTKGILDVRLRSLQVKGVDLPSNLTAILGQQNLAKDLNKDPRNQEKLGKLDSIQIQDGRILLKPRIAAPQAVEK